MLLFFLTLIGFWMGGEAFTVLYQKAICVKRDRGHLGWHEKGFLLTWNWIKYWSNGNFSSKNPSLLILNIYWEWIISNDGCTDMIDSYFSSNQPSVSKAFWLTDERAYTTGHQNQQSIMVMLLRLLLLLLARMCDKKEHKQNNNWCKKNHDHKQWLKKYHWLISDACLPLLLK